jgi:hypothetical protein
VLADHGEAAIVHQETPVSGRVRGFEAEHHDGRPVGKRRPQPLERRRLDERRIGEGDHHVVGAALERRARRQHRVRRAEALALDEDLGIGDEASRLGADVVAARTDDHGLARRPGGGDRRHDVAEHRPAGDLVQDLRPRRLHARPLARRQDDGEAAAAGRRSATLFRHRPSSVFVPATYQDFAAFGNAYWRKGRTRRGATREFDPLSHVSYIGFAARGPSRPVQSGGCTSSKRLVCHE